MNGIDQRTQTEYMQLLNAGLISEQAVRSCYGGDKFEGLVTKGILSPAHVDSEGHAWYERATFESHLAGGFVSPIRTQKGYSGEGASDVEDLSGSDEDNHLPSVDDLAEAQAEWTKGLEGIVEELAAARLGLEYTRRKVFDGF
jgi:hypothetical protein